MNPHTYRPYDEELSYLRNLVLDMATLVAAQLKDVIQALNQEDVNLAVTVMQRETKINQYELTIDAEVMKILARLNPLANDLRLVLAASKIVTDLERMGDSLVKIARMVVDINTNDKGKPNRSLFTGINEIADLIASMLNKTTLCFQSESVSEAHELVEEEYVNQQTFKQILEQQIDTLLTDTRLVSTTLDILHIMNALERCADHCINIGEHLVFMLEGRDIRHQPTN
jgi:phosphate transport system protein